MSNQIEKQSNRGGKREGAGRIKGTPNKVNLEFRETIRMLLEDNSDNVSQWLAEVAASNPGKALDLLTKLAEFAAPKLTRTEVVGDKENPLEMGISITFVKPR